MRLAKYLAHSGIGSRRACEQIIRDGRVGVGGEVVVDPARNVDASMPVTVDGEQVRPADTLVVYAVNKPSGVVSTAHDPQRRPTVVSLVACKHRLYPVGRLDIDTTGLILLTNDGELAHRLTHPSFEVPKTYRATVANAPVGDQALAAMREGVVLDDGPTAPAAIRRITADTLEITIHEGRKRQVKRMCESVGHPVRSLARIAIGPLELGDLRPGAHRRLTDAEVADLQSASARSTGRHAAAWSP
ncbi:MAG TPA: pseudouridine synthase [Solirubrobacteraceae bacterium]|nr:pseudouridine synthase [Solirubrobacteraceae bacterium]